MPLAAGDKLGPYDILAPIGAGGMGEVWKARDTRLNRIVAIKRLTGQHTGRFEQEARAIAALNHPHICQIYDVGPDYIVMEYVEGAPLKGPLAVEDAIRLAIQIASALEEAHAKRILHRDLKPANILVTSKGAAKLLDFGLAKLVTDADPEVTKTLGGAMMGTPAYMSPEQAEGKTLDERSDIFSFGVVLYELLSGDRAFAGDTMAQVLSAVLRDEPKPLQVSATLDRIVRQCLAKQPSQRFQSAAELKRGLESFSSKAGAAKSAEQKPSIAVLPFANMSADKENEYFSDGLAEEIINELAQISGLKVIARTSSFAFRGKEQDVRGIAEKLGVAHVLEGSVRKAGGRIRVTAQLIAAADGSHLWSHRYDRELEDVFAVQDEIAQAITLALKVRLATRPADTRRHKPNLPAYEEFLKGRHSLFLGTPEGFARARERFEKSIALDPEFAEPHAELGVHYFLLGTWDIRPAGEAMALARAEAKKALELSPGEPRAHSLLGAVAGFYDFDWKESEDQYRMAMAGDPVPPEVLIRSRLARLPLGRVHEAYDAINQINSALAQDPLNAFFHALFSMMLNGIGMYDLAIVEARKAIEIDERSWFAHFELAQGLAAQEALAEATQATEEAHRLAPWNSGAAGLLAGLSAISGDEDRAEALLGQLKPVGMLIYHSLCSDFDAAADSCKVVIENREAVGLLWASMSIWKPLREHPRWPELAKMLNLPEVE